MAANEESRGETGLGVDPGLARSQRWLFSAVGASLLIVGLIALFLDKNPPAVIAVIGIGAALVFAGILGNDIRRVRLSKSELVFAERLRGSIEKALTEETATSESVAAIVVDVADPKDPIFEKAESYLFSMKVRATVEAIIGREHVVGYDDPGASVDTLPGTFDAWVTKEDREIAIEAKTTRVGRNEVNRLIDLAQRRADGLILVSQTGFTEDARHGAAASHLPVELVEMHRTMDSAGLIEALTRLGVIAA